MDFRPPGPFEEGLGPFCPFKFVGGVFQRREALGKFNFGGGLVIPIPSIGIGAWVDFPRWAGISLEPICLDFLKTSSPKFVKRYLDGAELIRGALDNFVSDVKSKKFPSDEFIY